MDIFRSSKMQLLAFAVRVCGALGARARVCAVCARACLVWCVCAVRVRVCLVVRALVAHEFGFALGRATKVGS